MFTGLIEQKDTVLKVDSTMDDTELTINNNGFEDLKEGDSVAVNGVCLTAYEMTERSFKVTMINETKRITSLKDVKEDRKSTRLNSSHVAISYAGYCW